MRSFRAWASADPPPCPSKPYCGGNQSRPSDDEWASLMLFICLLFTQQSGKMRGQQQMGNVLILALQFLRGTHLMFTASGEAKRTRAWPPLNSGKLNLRRFLDLFWFSFSLQNHKAEYLQAGCRRTNQKRLFCYLDTHLSPQKLCASSPRFACLAAVYL